MSPSDVLAEHALGALPSDDVLHGLAAAGVELAALIRRWQRRPLEVPRLDSVIFDARGGFEFARYRNGIPDTGAMIFIVNDPISDAIDLAAWAPPRAPALWTARGSGNPPDTDRVAARRLPWRRHHRPAEIGRPVAPRRAAPGILCCPWPRSPSNVGSAVSSHCRAGLRR
jgi:hypothetical protein